MQPSRLGQVPRLARTLVSRLLDQDAAVVTGAQPLGPPDDPLGHVMSVVWLKDSVTMLVPSGADDIGAALDGLAISKVLGGYRGAPAANREALIQAILNIQAAAVGMAGELSEMDVNPLIATPTDAIAVDALIKLSKATTA